MVDLMPCMRYQQENDDPKTAQTNGQGPRWIVLGEGAEFNSRGI
jgi:hypothetical protein